MEQKLNTVKADFYNVFVTGSANSMQMARVFMVIAIPVMTICMIASRHIIY
jgi:hypothetical protein